MRHGASNGVWNDAGVSDSYYRGREESLADLFGANAVVVHDDHIDVDGRRLRVVEDVIVALPDAKLPPRLATHRVRGGDITFAPDIQRTFGAEWAAHGEVLPEHEAEFAAYFDIVDLGRLATARVADLGCGSGRWATFVAPRCRELVVVDFSEAIFVARRNLRSADRVIFVMADVLDLPFRDDAFDLAYCLGVLHHTPVDALDATRQLRRLAPALLVYLYYSLDNRPRVYRPLLAVVTVARLALSRIRGRRVRAAVSLLLAVLVYRPLALIGQLLGERGRHVPLADSYAGKSIRRLQQDAYDRFFTRIEQRFSAADIRTLTDTFSHVEISPQLPYWHFLCRR